MDLDLLIANLRWLLQALPGLANPLPLLLVFAAGLVLCALALWPFVPGPERDLLPGLAFALLVVVATAFSLARLPAWSLGGLLVGLGALGGWKARRTLSLNVAGLGLLALLLAYTLFRLTQIDGLAFPPYADSVTHTLVTANLAQLEEFPLAHYSLWGSDPHYYHFGFHALAAQLVFWGGASPREAVLVLGQILQGVLLLCAYPLLRRWAGSSAAALGAVAWLGLGGSMPAFAYNWGKYPALAGLAGLLLIWGVLDRLDQPGSRGRWIGLAALAGLAAGLLHSRMAILGVLGGLAWLLSRRLRPGLLLAALLAAALLAWTPEKNWAPLSVQIRSGGLPFWGLTLLVLAPALANRSRELLACGLFAGLCALGTVLPVPLLSRPLDPVWLVDRPLFEMLLPLPLALGAAAGLRAWQQHGRPWSPTGLILLLVLLSLGSHSLAPSPCCQFVREDDLVAFDWMKRSLSAETLVGIAAVGPAGHHLPADGGAWLELQTGLQTRRLPFDLPLESQEAWQALCREGISHLYVDGLANSFDPYDLENSQGSYRLLFVLEEVRVYALDCLDGAASR